MRISARGEAIAVAVTFGGLALTVLIDQGGHPLVALLRLTITAVALFILPGYFWHITLFPTAGALNGWERVALAISLSAASVPFLTLVLDGVLQVPLTLPVIALGVLGWTCLGALVALVRRRRLGPDAGFWMTIPLGNTVRVAALQGRVGTAIVVTVVGLVGLVGIAVVVTYTMPAPAQSYTQFYVLGQDGNAERYLNTLRVGLPADLRLGVINNEDRAFRAYIMVVIGNEPAGQSEIVNLEPGVKHEWTIPVTAVRASGPEPLTLQLWREQDNEAYRTLRLWVNVTD
jgi:uncharacterized membrane protein